MIYTSEVFKNYKNTCVVLEKCIYDMQKHEIKGQISFVSPKIDNSIYKFNKLMNSCKTALTFIDCFAKKVYFESKLSIAVDKAGNRILLNAIPALFPKSWVLVSDLFEENQIDAVSGVITKVTDDRHSLGLIKSNNVIICGTEVKSV